MRHNINRCIGSAHLCEMLDAGRILRSATIYATAIFHLLRPMVFTNIISEDLRFTTIIPVIKGKLQKIYILVV